MLLIKRVTQICNEIATPTAEILLVVVGDPQTILETPHPPPPPPPKKLARGLQQQFTIYSKNYTRRSSCVIYCVDPLLLLYTLLRSVPRLSFDVI